MEMVLDVAAAGGSWVCALFCMWRMPTFLTQMLALLTAFRPRDAAAHERFCALLFKLRHESGGGGQMLE